ncbi:MAG: ABC transporter ATP-binding protein [Halieaceae bacterium]|jgi:ATP-binding cassette, subfamily B, bacterial|nr:ABC transporter ATP-binding protein [Halieaceae bacterium]
MLRGLIAKGGEALAEFRWAQDSCRRYSPRAYRLYWPIMLVSIVFPAGIAWSLRGLINSVDYVLKGHTADETTIYPWLALGFLMALGAAVCNWAQGYLRRRLELDLQYALNLRLLEHNDAMPFTASEDQGYRDSLNRANRTPEIHVGSVYRFTVELLVRFAQISSLVAILFWIEPLLFYLLLPVGCPYLLFRMYLSRRQFEEVDSRVRKQRWINYYRGLLTDPEQTGEIKINMIGVELIRRCAGIMREFRDLLIRYHYLEYVGAGLFSLASIGVIYIAMTSAAMAIIQGRLTIGDLVIFGSAATQLRALVESSIGLASSLRWELLHVSALMAYLDIAPDKVDGPVETVVGARGAVEFRNVYFSYSGSDEAAIVNLSFRIEPGETVALVGSNGAGKTTIAKLVAGFYMPDSGEILFDGVDCRQMTATARFELVACVFQQFGRYAATVADNIAFGDWQRLRSDTAAIEAIGRRAGIDQMITAMPQEHQTLLGREFGQYQPSGGEWQQIAIARLIARNAPVLLLDEPTASLDVEAEKALFSQLAELARERTAIVISHRFSTVSIADRIFVIADGTLTESGSHQELLVLNGIYSRLYGLAASQFYPT